MLVYAYRLIMNKLICNSLGLNRFEMAKKFS